MTAFEIHLNGRKRCTAGVAEAGVLVAALTWTLGDGKEDVENLDFRVGGLIGRTHTFVDWLHRPLKAGDELKIVVVKKAKVDRARKRHIETKATRSKREWVNLEQRAAKLGLTLLKPATGGG